jgi:hypothetical protein
MREIKFRGQRLHNEEWVYGYYNKALTPAKYGDILTQHRINLTGIENYFVIPETVGQYTGLKDKKGVEIYEGDILRFPAENEWEKTNYSCFEVFFHDGDANSDYNIGYSMNRMHNHGSVCGGHTPSFKPKTVSKMIIIGNIHSNPELLK